MGKANFILFIAWVFFMCFAAVKMIHGYLVQGTENYEHDYDDDNDFDFFHDQLLEHADIHMRMQQEHVSSFQDQINRQMHDTHIRHSIDDINNIL